MRYYLGTAMLLFAGLVRSATAAPIQYNIGFSLQNGAILPTAGSFTYDATTTTFTNFEVTWDGVVFDLTNGANNPVLSGPGLACIGGATGGAASFIVVSGGCYHAGPGPSNTWLGNPQSGQPGVGRFRFRTGDASSFIEIFGNAPDASGNQAAGQWNTSAAPEPSALILVALGLFSLVLVARSRRAV